ncbi:MAG: hypothetical protein WA081_06035 [Desulfosalsimonadaceae bacterium]
MLRPYGITDGIACMTDNTRYNPQIHHRRSIRLKGYDYSRTGAYFITICAHNRLCLFGEIIDGEMRANPCGETAAACWRDLPRHFETITLGDWVVMPNHIHGILVIGRGEASAVESLKPIRWRRMLRPYGPMARNPGLWGLSCRIISPSPRAE